MFEHLCVMLTENHDPIIQSYLQEVSGKQVRNVMSVYDFETDGPAKEAVKQKIALYNGIEAELRRLVAAIVIQKHVDDWMDAEAIVPAFEQPLKQARKRKPWDAAYRIHIQRSDFQVFPRPVQSYFDYAHLTNREYDVSNPGDIVGVVELLIRSEDSPTRTMPPESFIRSNLYNSVNGFPNQVEDKLLAIAPEDAVVEAPKVLTENIDVIVEHGIFIGSSLQGFAHFSEFDHILEADIDREHFPDNCWVLDLEKLQRDSTSFAGVF